MKLSNWIRFTWDLTRLPAFENTLPEHYEIGAATADDEMELRKIISATPDVVKAEVISAPLDRITIGSSVISRLRSDASFCGPNCPSASMSAP